MNILLSILHFAFITKYFTSIQEFGNSNGNGNNIKIKSTKLFFSRNYSPFGRKYYEDYIKNLNSKNVTIQNNYILGLNNAGASAGADETIEDDLLIKTINKCWICFF